MFTEFNKIILEQEEQYNESLDIEKFLAKVSKYDSLDDALLSLPDSYIEFYFKNSKLLNKSLKNMGLVESITPENPGYVGWSPTPQGTETTYKNIKYKGNIITLEYNPELRTWFPQVRFRSVTQALKYAKSLVDDIDIK